MQKKNLLIITLTGLLALCFLAMLGWYLIRSHCVDDALLPVVQAGITPSKNGGQPLTLRDITMSSNIVGKDALTQQSALDRTGRTEVEPHNLSSSAGVLDRNGPLSSLRSSRSPLQNNGMESRLQSALQREAQAQIELESMQQLVKLGKIHIVPNHGLFFAVMKSERILTVVIYDSPTGPVRSYSKNVYKDLTYGEEINARGYELHFYASGAPKVFFSRDMRDILNFRENGSLLRFAATTPDKGNFLAEWDKNGGLVKSGYSLGIIGETKNGKYIKYPNHPDYEIDVSDQGHTVGERGENGVSPKAPIKTGRE
jgi:hypothetical protein